MAIKEKETAAKLTMGPVLFNWEPEIWRDFHFRIADEADIDTVYIGESVCSKRIPLFYSHMDEVAERLKKAGKEVVFSSLGLVMTKKDIDSVTDLTDDNDKLIEANDVSAIAHLKGREHVIGPLINVYNEGTLRYLAGNGAKRFCLPPELPAITIKTLAENASDINAETELQVFGRLPLALSSRCYHARIHKLSKDKCRFVCNKDVDGLDLKTLDDKPFLSVNGIQTMSYSCLNLIEEMEELKSFGVSHFRLSPQSCDMVAVSSIFRDVLDKKLDANDADEHLKNAGMTMPFSNGFYHQTNGHCRVA